MTNEELLVSCKNGDSKAQSLLYVENYKLLYGICFKYLKNEDDTLDYLHDGFLHIISKLTSIDVNKITSLKGWLAISMRNFVIDNIRKNKKTKKIKYFDFLDIDLEENTDDSPIISNNILMSLINELKPNAQKILIMYVLDGMSHQEIADELSISLSKVKTTFHRVKKTLKNKIYKLKLSV